MKKYFLAITCLCSIFSSYAGGFKIGLQGQKQIGMGHTGTALALDASTVYFNPAAMVHTPNLFTVGITGLVPRTQYLDAATQTITNAVNQTFTPLELYGTYALNKKLVAGIGIYTPFGSGVKYPSNWTGRYILTDINLTALFFQPTVSYKLNKNLSIGAGFIYSNGHFNLEKDIPVQGQNTTEVGHAKLNSSANGIGFNAGLYYTKNKGSIGLVYRSGVRMNANNGMASFTNIPSLASASFPNTKFSTALPLPGEVDLGVSYKLSKRLLVAADYNYTLWHTYDSLGFDYEINTTKLSDAKEARLYKNAGTLHGGAQYQINKKVFARVGAFYDWSPVKDGYVSPELPDANKLGATCGLSIQLSKYITLDASLLYENVTARKQQNVITNLNGTFQTKVIAPGIGITYNFKPSKLAPNPIPQKDINNNNNN
jgi:long-chain fatty acid transport protein